MSDQQQQQKKKLTKLEKQQTEKFREGMMLVFNSWKEMWIILENEPVGGQTKEYLVELLENLCLWVEEEAPADLTAQEIRDYIHDVLENDMNVLLEDDSHLILGQQMLSYYEQCCNNDFSKLDSLKELFKSDKNYAVRVPLPDVFTPLDAPKTAPKDSNPQANDSTPKEPLTLQQFKKSKKGNQNVFIVDENDVLMGGESTSQQENDMEEDGDDEWTTVGKK